MLTPKQMVRIFHLCADILAIQRELAPPPVIVSEEIFAAALLPYMQAKSALFVELRELLQAAQ
jgi:hypothetical protein